jgi:hypothetical protein
MIALTADCPVLPMASGSQTLSEEGGATLPPQPLCTETPLASSVPEPRGTA